jgi:hypothetical protein
VNLRWLPKDARERAAAISPPLGPTELFGAMMRGGAAWFATLQACCKKVILALTGACRALDSEFADPVRQPTSSPMELS